MSRRILEERTPLAAQDIRRNRSRTRCVVPDDKRQERRLNGDETARGQRIQLEREIDAAPAICTRAGSIVVMASGVMLPLVVVIGPERNDVRCMVNAQAEAEAGLDTHGSKRNERCHTGTSPQCRLLLHRAISTINQWVS